MVVNEKRFVGLLMDSFFTLNLLLPSVEPLSKHGNEKLV
jgi:hypothetical protein